MGRPKKGLHKVATPDRILVAAEEAFAAVGYESCRLEDIAAVAGIRRPSLLYHFETKELLYGAVVRQVYTALLETLSPAMSAEAAYEDVIESLLDAFLGFLESRPGFAPIVVRELLAGDGPGALILRDELAPILDVVENYLSTASAGQLPAGIPVRGAIMQVVSDALLRSSAGVLQGPLWGEEVFTQTLARRLLVR